MTSPSRCNLGRSGSRRSELDCELTLVAARDRQWAADPRATLDISTNQASVLATDQPRPSVR
jgi:hypothetical protein